jgi:agmatine/peptidylarginine deiminase
VPSEQEPNPSLSRDEISEVLKTTLGVSRVIYLPHGLYADETDGHVDNIACFLDEHTVLIPYTRTRTIRITDVSKKPGRRPSGPVLR